MNILSIFGANLSALGFGGSNVVAKIALGKLGVIQTLVIGTAAGSVLLFFISLFTGDLSIARTILPIAFGMAILEVLLYLVLYKAFAIANITVAVSVLSTYPAFSLVLAVLFLNESITPLKAGLVLLIIFGALLTSIDWRGVFKDGLDKKDLVKGLPWILLCLVFHVVYFPLLSVYTGEDLWETKLFFIKIISFVIFTAIFLVLRRKNHLNLPPIKKMLPPSMAGIFEVIGWVGLSFAYVYAANQVGTVIALGSTSPLFTAVGAYIFLKERLKPLQYVGVIITLVGVIALSV